MSLPVLSAPASWAGSMLSPALRVLRLGVSSPRGCHAAFRAWIRCPRWLATAQAIRQAVGIPPLRPPLVLHVPAGQAVLIHVYPACSLSPFQTTVRPAQRLQMAASRPSVTNVQRRQHTLAVGAQTASATWLTLARFSSAWTA